MRVGFSLVRLGFQFYLIYFLEFSVLVYFLEFSVLVIVKHSLPTVQTSLWGA